MISFNRTHRPLRVATLCAGLPLVVALAASPADAQTSTAAPQFATGAVTSIHGSSVQVDNQNQNSESTVVVTGTTNLEKREPGAASDIAVGDCVRVIGTGSAAKGIKASTVAVSPAAENGCGPGARGGTFGGGAGQGRPNFGNGAAPPGGFRNRNGNGNRTGGRPRAAGIASGPVVSVSGDHMIVKATMFSRPTKKNAKPKTTTKKVSVTLGNSTSIMRTVPATITDLTVGSCVTAIGASDAGAVTATNVTISAPVNGSCSFGFGSRPV